MFQTLKIAACMYAGLAFQPACAEISVSFDDPKRFSDFTLSGSGGTDAAHRQLLAQLDRHIKNLAEHHLPKGDNLEMTVRNVDMAGSMEPWRTENFNNTRFLHGSYPPKIALHYLWRDRNGKVKADRNTTVTCLNYLIDLSANHYPTNDPLRYEKAMLDRWFANVFTETPPAPLAAPAPLPESP